LATLVLCTNLFAIGQINCATTNVVRTADSMRQSRWTGSRLTAKDTGVRILHFYSFNPCSLLAVSSASRASLKQTSMCYWPAFETYAIDRVTYSPVHRRCNGRHQNTSAEMSQRRNVQCQNCGAKVTYRTSGFRLQDLLYGMESERHAGRCWG